MKIAFACLLVLAALPLRADQVDMQNGDRYTGRVLSLSADAVVLQNEFLGKITLPRHKVTHLTVGAVEASSATSAAAAAPDTNQTAAHPILTTATNANADLAATFKQLGANTNLVAQIKGQFLSEAGPEASKQFDDMLGDLVTGKIDVTSLRTQAKSAADQLRGYQKQLGPEAGDMIDTYLAVLDNFLKETDSK